MKVMKNMNRKENRDRDKMMMVKVKIITIIKAKMVNKIRFLISNAL